MCVPHVELRPRGSPPARDSPLSVQRLKDGAGRGGQLSPTPPRTAPPTQEPASPRTA